MGNFLSLDEQQAKAMLDSIQKLSDWFWGPDSQKCGEILSGVYWQPFQTLEVVLEYDPPGVLQKIKSAMNDFSDEDSLFQYLETAYVRLFISHRDGIAAPLYESCYVDVESGVKAPLMGEPAVRMKKRIESKGLSIDSNIHEPPDHLAIELEYLYFLLHKGWIDQDGRLIAEAGSFAADSMLPWVSELQKQVAFHMKDHAYCFLVSMLTAILRRIGEFEK